jgi:hypothetical protein
LYHFQLIIFFIVKLISDYFPNLIFAQPHIVLIFNNNAFVILTAMTEKQGSEWNKGDFVGDDNNKAKLIAGIAIAGIMVTSILFLSGLSLISSYQQPAIAQVEDLIGGAGGTTAGGTESGTTGGGNATTAAGGGNQTTAEVMLHLEEVRTAIENDDDEAALMHLDLALNVLAGNGGIQGNMTTGATIAGTDATNTSNEDGAPGVGGTSAADEDIDCGGVTVGGTSAADDYGCPPDPDS